MPTETVQNQLPPNYASLHKNELSQSPPSYMSLYGTNESKISTDQRNKHTDTMIELNPNNLPCTNSSPKMQSNQNIKTVPHVGFWIY